MTGELIRAAIQREETAGFGGRFVPILCDNEATEKLWELRDKAGKRAGSEEGNGPTECFAPDNEEESHANNMLVRGGLIKMLSPPQNSDSKSSVDEDGSKYRSRSLNESVSQHGPGSSGIEFLTASFGGSLSSVPYTIAMSDREDGCGEPEHDIDASAKFPPHYAVVVARGGCSFLEKVCGMRRIPRCHLIETPQTACADTLRM